MAFLLSIYLVLHLCAGLALPWRRGFKPYFFLLMEKAGLGLERRLNRETRPQSVRFIRGMVVGVVMGLAGLFTGVAVQLLGQTLYGWAALLVFLPLCINFMTPLKLVRQILRHLGRNELQGAIEVLQPYVQESLDKADAHTVIRKTIEFIALSLNQFLLAPAFWFLAAGPMGLAVYTTYAALQQAFGIPDWRRRYFGLFVRGVDALLNLFPALLTALLLTISSLFVSRSSPLRAGAMILRHAGRGPYTGWAIAAFAGGLGVTLGGPMHFAGTVMERAWIGPEGSSARLLPQDLIRATLLQYVFFIGVIGIVSGIILLEI